MSDANEEFLAAMHRALKKNKAKDATAMFRALMQTVLVVQTREPLAPEMLTKDTQVEFAVIQNPNGDVALPTFTSDAALRRWHHDADHMIGLEAPQLFRRALESGFDVVLVDHADEQWIQLDRALLADLVEGRLPA